MLSHPNIVKIHEIVQTPQEVHLVMDYVEGQDLFDLITSRLISEEQAKKIFFQIASAVNYSHSLGIVHRDLKPENILIDKDGTVKLIDWGLSVISNNSDPNNTNFNNSPKPKTYKNSNSSLKGYCGSPEYAAPEVHVKGTYTYKVDCWSLGVLLYVMIEASYPWDREDPEEMMRAIKCGEYIPPENASDLCKDLISRLLVVDPIKRATTDEILSHLWLKDVAINNNQSFSSTSS